MKYVADLLTLSRAVLGLMVLVEIWYHNWLIVAVLFIIAALTDAVDGACAKVWPYLSNQKFWFPLNYIRKDPHGWDNFADVVLVYSTMLGLAVTLPGWAQASLIQIVVGLVMLKSLSIYSNKDPYIAEKIDVALGWMYVLQLFAMLISITMQAVQWWPIATVFYAVFGVLLLIVRWDKATSRPDAAYWKKI